MSTMRKTDPPILVEAHFDSGVADLWNALTLLREMREWYFGMIPDFEARPGFRTSFEVRSEARTFTHLWQVLEVVPSSRITYSWRFREYDGASTSTFEVSGNEDCSKLKLTVLVQEDFPAGIPEFTRESCIGGWDYFIHGNLKKYLSAESY